MLSIYIVTMNSVVNVWDAEL